MKFKQEVAVCFAENLRRCRRRSGLSQEKLGFRASLHRTEIGLLERGARVPQLDTILKLAGGLSVSPCELITDMTWRPGNFSPGGFNLTGRPERAPHGSDEHRKADA
jgi:transcriptional regulator with XRE-family HTH domain